MENIYLCGFMGCGKTTVGKVLARMLGRKFIDMDDEIVQRAGKTIPEIFSELGEGTFRKYETRLLEEYSSKKSMVVSTGGGVFTNYKNAEIAGKNGTIIFLDADFDLCYGRVHLDKNRPNAASRSKQELKELYDTRKPLYLKACAHAVNADGSPLEIAKRISELVKSV